PRGGIEEIRARDRIRKREALEVGKALRIPKPEDPLRRQQLESDALEWLRWYFADIFTDPFQDHHIEMIRAIENATVYAGDQAIAAPRGEAKSTIAECVTIRNILKGALPFAVLFAATAHDATNSLGSIKEYIVRSDRLLADYPEVCVPARDVDGTPNRAHSCLVVGDEFPITNARFQWSGDEISMPRVPGSACAGSIIATRGLDAAVRGLKKGKLRPSLAVIDDPDTENSALSEEQATKLIRRIDRAIAGLAPKGRRMSRVMLTTIQNRTCASAQFTDAKLKPSWKGKRFAFLHQKPERMDLWDEYVSLRQQAMSEGDEFGRKAHQFYLEHRGAMDAGAQVANPFSFDGRTLPDGSQLQGSAVQRYFDFVADNGEHAALSELQNDPPAESGPIESGITAYRIQTQVSGFPRKVVPPGCSWITQAIDVRKAGLHFVVRAWLLDNENCLSTAYTIDYGFQDSHGTTPGSDEGVDVAIKQAILARKDMMEREPYIDTSGVARKVDLTLVDAGWRTEAIHEACREIGMDWKPAMGFGKSNGCAKTSFTGVVHNTADKKKGDRWFLSRRPGGTWLVCTDTDFWKSWEHDRWMSDPNKAGSMLLWGEPSDRVGRLSQDQKSHFSYSKHLTAEIEVEEVVKGMLKRGWKSKSDSNHYFDASYMSDVAASMLGVRLVRTGSIAPTVTLNDWMAARAAAARSRW
ncbi:MAG: terminase gpA endonuclease subunit, partial [Thermoguttaceae bacterium]